MSNITITVKGHSGLRPYTPEERAALLSLQKEYAANGDKWDWREHDPRRHEVQNTVEIEITITAN